jgi:hypothetical protein
MALGNPVSYTDPSGLFSLAEHNAAVSIANTLSQIQFESGERIVSSILNGGEVGIGDTLLDIGITVTAIAAPYVLPYAARGLANLQANIQRKIIARRLANSVDELRLTRTVSNHLSDYTDRLGLDGGRYSDQNRPFINSPLLYEQIMKSQTPRPDPRGVSGALSWSVPGSFRGRDGVWELVIDPDTKTVLHFNFTTR